MKITSTKNTKNVGTMNVVLLSVWLVVLGAVSVLADPAQYPKVDKHAKNSAALKMEESTEASTTTTEELPVSSSQPPLMNVFGR